MLFNSLTFAIFFAVTYALYVCMRHRMQNVLLLVASYVFYGFWDWRFLTLIVGSTLVDYFCGLGIHRSEKQRHRRRFLAISVSTNLGLLGFFKYFDFFAGSLQEMALGFGWQMDPFTLNVVLPVGISFYTFQTMSYTIDIYRGTLKPTRNLLDLAVFVAFFPQLVAGPIERAAHLLPQVQSPRRVTEQQFHRGLWLIFLGLFKKVFVADNLAPIVNRAFGGGVELTGAELLVALYAFAFQIYGDFSGYSDIARGISKLMGFEIMLNFRMPYFARNAREFWHRWHISLSTWLRDYLYISMGGGRGSQLVVYRNLMNTMMLGGLWHGAAWTFVIWGMYQGALLSLHRSMSPAFDSIHRVFRRAEHVWTLLSIFVTFHFVCLGWLIFRASTPEQIFDYLRAVVLDFGAPTSALGDMIRLAIYAGPLLTLQLAKEWTGDMYVVERLGWASKGILYFVMAVLLLAAGASGGPTFIYFQF
jgi:D-alanyl-lipoteichoic acid acyltransferase DltB (MBOAT superfamily)